MHWINFINKNENILNVLLEKFPPVTIPSLYNDVAFNCYEWSLVAVLTFSDVSLGRIENEINRIWTLVNKKSSRIRPLCTLIETKYYRQFSLWFSMKDPCEDIWEYDLVERWITNAFYENLPNKSSSANMEGFFWGTQTRLSFTYKLFFPLTLVPNSLWWFQKS